MSDRRPAFVVLRHHDYRLLFVSMAVESLGAKFQFTAVSWQIFQLTHDAFYLGLVGLIRFVPILLFGLFGGVIADRFERRRTLLATQTLLLLTSATLLGLSLDRHASLPAIYVITACAGLLDTVAQPARSAFIPALVPRAEMSSALSVSFLASQTASIAGPAAAGIVIATLGVPAAFAVDTAGFVVVIALLSRIRTRSIVTRTAGSALGAAIEGLRFLRRSPILLCVMSVDFFATFFGAITALLPVYAATVLDGNAGAYGLLLSGEPMGAVIGSLIISALPTIRRPGLGVLVAVGIFGASIAGLGMSRTLLLAMVFLAMAGAADSISMALRHIVRNLVTPDTLRGRIAAAHSTFASGGPQLGDFRGGLLGSLVGPAPALVLGGAGVLVTVLAARWLVPSLATTSLDMVGGAASETVSERTERAATTSGTMTEGVVD